MRSPDFKADLARSGPHEVTVSFRLDDLPTGVRAALLSALEDPDTCRELAEEVLEQATEPLSGERRQGGRQGFTIEPVLVHCVRVRATRVLREKLVELDDGLQVFA